MTQESEIAKSASVHFEGWKWKITEQTGGLFRIPFDVKSRDLPEIIKNAPVGTRFMIVVVELNDDETPRVDTASPSSDKAVTGEAGGSGSQPKSPRKWDELPYSQRAAIRCGEPVFQDFIETREGGIMPNRDDADAYVKEYCGVKSKAEIIPSSYAAKCFDDLEEQYDTWLKYERGR